FNGGQVAVQSTGSGKGGIFLIAPKFQLSANGLYQAPWGINLGANFVMRQGYAQPFYRDRVNFHDAAGTPSNQLLLVNSIDQFRLDPVSSFDARVEKQVKFQKTNLALDL